MIDVGAGIDGEAVIDAGAVNSKITLALAASGDVCGIAVLRSGKLVVERNFLHEMRLSERLIGQLDGALHDAGYGLEDVDVLAVGVGPGSFTGARVGVMTAKTLAEVLGKPVYGICDLDALALEYRGITNAAIVPMFPCRTDVVFTCAFDVSELPPKQLFSPCALSISELNSEIRHLSVSSVIYCGTALSRYQAQLSTALAVDKPSHYGIARDSRAAAIGELAWLRWLSGDLGDDVLELAPLYISPPPITLPKGLPLA